MTTRVEGSSTQEALIQAAAAVFARVGYERASIRTISRAAQVNLAAVNYYFGSKQGLYEAVLASKLRPIVSATRGACDQGPNVHPIESLVSMLTCLVRALRADPDAGSLFLYEMAGPRPASKITREVVRDIIHELTRWVAEGQASGVVREGSPALLAMTALAHPIFIVLAERRLASDLPLHQGDVQPASMVVDHMERYVRAALKAQT